ncbi:MAG: polymer-forming cytoskeletal protein [Firmicutes bacterium]|nr:polymer-forming cytoskeletal protein [Bacillota bacterium]
MFWRRRENLSVNEKVDTLLGKNTSFEGTVEAEGTLRVDGLFKGTLKASGDIIVGEGAKVEAELKARHVLIAGEVRGRVEAAGKLELTATGRLYGELQAARLAVEEGAVFQGTCETVEDALASQAGPVLKQPELQPPSGT